MKPFLFNQPMNSSLFQEMNSFAIDIDSPYSFDKKKVPRVTQVLSEMIHDEYLMNWANYMGRCKHVDHNVYRDRAASIGTHTHSAIEKYTQLNYVDTFESIDNIYDRLQVKNAFYSFKLWWDILNTHRVNVIFQEKHLVCEYYGGTLDMLVQVDNRVYLVDFKTSNHFNYKYHLQTAAYRRILYTKYNINVDGIIILKLSKDKVYFEEQVLDFTRYDHVEYINNCERMFLSLVYAWYNRYIVENQYKKIY